jgi:hypothetical protein
MPRAQQFGRFWSDGQDHDFLEPLPAVAVYQRGLCAWVARADRAARDYEAAPGLAAAWERGFDCATRLLPTFGAWRLDLGGGVRVDDRHPDSVER